MPCWRAASPTEPRKEHFAGASDIDNGNPKLIVSFHIHTYTCMCIYIYICTYIDIDIDMCLYVCMYVYIYIYIYMVSTQGVVKDKTQHVSKGLI